MNQTTSVFQRFKSLGQIIGQKMFGGTAVIEGMPSAEIYSPFGKPKKFNPFAAVDQYKSWAYNAANMNAIACAEAKLRLFTTRGTGEGMPKVAPFKRLAKDFQHHVLRKQKISTAEDVELIEITEHPFLDLLKNANPFRNGFDYTEETSLWIDCTGNSYWYVEAGEGLTAGLPSALWILPSNYMSIIPDKAKFISGYVYGVYGKRIVFDETEIVHFRMPNLHDQWYGMGRIEAAYTEVLTAEELTNFEYSQAANRGIQDLLFKYNKGKLDRQQRRDLMAEFRNQLFRQKKEPTPLIADEDFTIDKISWSPRELLALNQREWSKETILAAFGQTMGLYSRDAARANIEGALYKWMRFTIDPALTRIAQKLNEKLLPRYGQENLFCQFDTQAERDRTFDLEQEKADRAGNIRTINEIRQSRNLAKLDDERADDPFAGSTPAPSSFGSYGSYDGMEEVVPPKSRRINGKHIHRTLKDVPVEIKYP